jgi:hypothetical protein
MGIMPQYQETPMFKGLWKSIQGDPVFMRTVNGWMTLFWIVMIPISIITGWINSVTYVAALALWALVSGHWAAWQAARTEVKQEEDARKREEERVAEEVVEEILDKTQLQPQSSSSPIESRPS